ncbi:MAG: AarF/UbiB family protein [Myxococcota bacterium]|nr:AarF/UbiB family protein [Myxococcota bacterium]
MPNVSSVYRNVKSLRTAIKDVTRLRQIVLILVKHGFGAVVTKLGLGDIVGLRSTQIKANKDEEKLTFAVRIRLSIEELGPTFIKLGQILSTRPDLVPPDIILELQKLQDDVPPMDKEDVFNQVRDELGENADEIYKYFADEPLACASVAQVHRAILKDDVEVVVKVKRRNVDGTIDSDLNILHFLAQQSEQLIPELRLINPVGIVKEFDRAIRQELDFTIEKGNIDRFTKNFEDFEGLRAPQIYPELCTVGILTMEFIQGVKVTQAPEKMGTDPYIVAPIIMKALFKMMLKDGLLHGDLHPGNILITKDHEIILIDFGLCGRLLPKQREDILDLLLAVAKEDYEQVAKTIFDMGLKVPGVHYDFHAFELDVIDVMERHIMGKTLEAIDVQAYFADLVAGAIRHQIRMPPSYTMVFKALMTVEGIGKTLAPKINFLDETRPFVQEMLMERYNPRRLLKESFDLVSNTTKFVRNLSELGPKVLRDLENGQLSIQSEVRDLDTKTSQITRELRFQSRAILTGSLLITGANITDIEISRWIGVPIFSIGAFILGGILGIPLFLKLLRN